MTNPTPTPGARAELHSARAPGRYQWHLIEVGKWQEWLNLPPSTTIEIRRWQGRKLRAAAADYARRHGLRVESCSSAQHRIMDLRFTARTDSDQDDANTRPVGADQ